MAQRVHRLAAILLGVHDQKEKWYGQTPVLVNLKEEWNLGICSKMDATGGGCGG